MRLIVVLVLLILSMPAFSASWTNGNQIIRSVIWKPGHHGFYVEPATYQDTNATSCGDTSNVYFIDSSLPEKEVDRLYSMILIALTTGKRVHVWITGCDSPYVTFSGLQINN